MKYKFVVSGAAEGDYCGHDAEKKAYTVGQEIIKQGGILITGATTGMPLWSAKGAKETGGISVGISPAGTEKSHIEDYKLPSDYFDFIIFSGFGYAGRNLILTKSADAVIIVCGGFGTLNEFTIALEDNKPVGILVGTGGISEEVKGLLDRVKDPHNHGQGKVIFSEDPADLISKLTGLIEAEKKYLNL